MNKKKSPYSNEKLKKRTLCIICLSSSRKGRKNSNKVTNFERIKKKHDYFVLVCTTRFYMMYSLCTSVNSLIHSIILIFALNYFFPKQTNKTYKIFHPSPNLRKKSLFSASRQPKNYSSKKSIITKTKTKNNKKVPMPK